jgi:hypothetical protein
MQKFEYRVPRFAADIPVRLTVGNTSLTGRCREIGKQGMTVEMDQPIEREASGLVSLNYQGRALEVRAHVAHADGQIIGLEFLFATEAERTAVAQVIAALSSTPKRPGPILLQ